MLILRLWKVIFKNKLFTVDCIGSLLLQSFSSCGKQGLLSGCGERASCCSASLVVEHGAPAIGVWAQ